MNVYFKILEKASLVLQGSYNFHRATTRNSADLYSATLSGTASGIPQKIMFFNTNFSKRISTPEYLKDCYSYLRDFFKYDIVLVPFFSDTEDDKRALIVVIKVATSTVDLYDREREEDSKYIIDDNSKYRS